MPPLVLRVRPRWRGAGATSQQLLRLWTEFRKRIEPVRQDLPDGLTDTLTLYAIADLIRLIRNEGGTRLAARSTRTPLGLT